MLECMARVGTVTRPTVLHGKATWDYRDQGEDLRLIMVWEEDETLQVYGEGQGRQERNKKERN